MNTATQAAYIYDESDDHGSYVLLCRACIEADRHEVKEWEDIEDRRCACCGATGNDDDDPAQF